MKRPFKIALWLVAILLVLLLAGGYVYYYFRSGGIPRVTVDTNLFPVKGVDISSHNNDINFKSLVDDGVEFVYIKSTEGATYKDSRFHHNYRMARKAGLLVGAYHFFRFETDGEMQAINICNSLRGKHLDLPVAIDVEDWTNPDGIPTNIVSNRLSRLVKYLRESGFDVAIYTNMKGYYRFYRNRLEDYPLWICSFRNPPLDDSRNKPLFWQHSHLGSVKGASGFIDLNVFYGNRAEWDSWLEKRRNTPTTITN